jgi:hypothetical protein
MCEYRLDIDASQHGIDFVCCWQEPIGCSLSLTHCRNR